MSQYRICCDTMSVQLTHECEQHPDRFNCPGVLIVYDAKLDEYGMPIRDDGHSVMSIQFCSWWGRHYPNQNVNSGSRRSRKLVSMIPLDNQFLTISALTNGAKLKLTDRMETWRVRVAATFQPSSPCGRFARGRPSVQLRLVTRQDEETCRARCLSI